MENKIKVEICCGTTCYMLGAAELLKLEDLIPAPWKAHVDVSAMPCLEACTREDLGRAPFVRIDGELIGNATLENVFAELEKRMGGANE